MCSFRLSTCLFVSRKQRTWMFNQAPHHAEHAPSTAAIAAVPLRRYAALRDRRYFAGAGVRRPARMRLQPPMWQHHESPLMPTFERR